LNTPWRKHPSWYGGLFIDAFVHASAGLRLVLGSPKSVSATTSSQADYLPGVDTMVAQVQWLHDAMGVILVSYAAQKLKFELEVTGTKGTVTLQRSGSGYKLLVNNEDEQEFGLSGIEAEFLAFAQACRGKRRDSNTPLEALKDLEFVEACLQSGKDGGKTVYLT